MTKPPSPKAPFKSRSAGRMAAVQALFQVEHTGMTATSVVLEFLEHRRKDKEGGAARFETTFFTKLVEGAWLTRENADEMVKGTLKPGWTLDRIEPVTRAVLRAALYEILESKTPTPVIIDEYLNITRAFFDDTEVGFVNGVLNTLARGVRSQQSV